MKEKALKKKTITLRLDLELYQKFFNFAKIENRTISNLIETLAINKLEEKMFTDDIETKEILSDKELLESLKRGHKQAKEGKTRRVA